jgi:hypothetical protein
MTARSSATFDRAVIAPGASLRIALPDEGAYGVGYFAVDLLGHREPDQHLRVRIDRTGRPSQACPDIRASSGPQQANGCRGRGLRDSLSGGAGVTGRRWPGGATPPCMTVNR